MDLSLVFLGTGGSVPNSFDRTLLRLRPFEEYLATGWTHVGTPDEVRRDPKFVDLTNYIWDSLKKAMENHHE